MDIGVASVLRIRNLLGTRVFIGVWILLQTNYTAFGAAANFLTRRRYCMLTENEYTLIYLCSMYGMIHRLWENDRIRNFVLGFGIYVIYNVWMINYENKTVKKSLSKGRCQVWKHFFRLFTCNSKEKIYTTDGICAQNTK